MLPQQRELQNYLLPNGKSPFLEWVRSLKDSRSRNIIFKRVERLREGNPGDSRFVRQGVSELRIHFGPGYRVYFAEDGPVIIILLCGGDKTSQRRDIEKAQAYWEAFQSRKRSTNIQLP